MSRFLIPAGFVVLLLLFWFMLDRMGSGDYNPRDIPTEFIGKPAPKINVPDLYKPDVTVTTEGMKGRVWLFNVWGTWCPECWREHAYLMRLSEQKIPIVGLNWRDDAAEARAMLQRLGNPFVAIGYDPDSSVAIDWGVYGAPETFLVDEQGIIRAKHAGGVTAEVWNEKFRPFFEEDNNRS